jgi:hypothetical protein
VSQQGLMVSNFNNDVLNGLYSSLIGTTTLFKLNAYRASVTITTGSDISTNTADMYNYGLFNTGVYAKSASASDTAAGTGCRTLLVEGVDDSGLQAGCILIMNGTTTSGYGDVTFSRINKIQVWTSGTGLTNAGKITLYDATNTELLNIGAGESASFGSFLSTSSTNLIILRTATIITQTTAPMNVYFKVKTPAQAIWLTQQIAFNVSGCIAVDLNLKLPQSSDFRIFAIPSSGAGPCNVSIDYYSITA